MLAALSFSLFPPFLKMALTTRACIEQLQLWIAEKEQPDPLRARIQTYLTQRKSRPLLSLRSFVSTLLVTKRAASLPITLDELVQWELTLTELLADAGCAVSLTELVNAHIVTSMADLIGKLKATLADFLGPFESESRRARLNPTLLVQLLGEEAVRALREEPLNVRLVGLIKTYGPTSLHPTDFRALGIGFSLARMKEAPILKAVGEVAVPLFSRFPRETWFKEAGLSDDYLRLLFPKIRTRVDVDRHLQWHKS